ncbi:MAG: hypothetical protein ACHP83_16395 [Burkholderiales bacterium]
MIGETFPEHAAQSALVGRAGCRASACAAQQIGLVEQGRDHRPVLARELHLASRSGRDAGTGRDVATSSALQINERSARGKMQKPEYEEKKISIASIR